MKRGHLNFWGYHIFGCKKVYLKIKGCIGVGLCQGEICLLDINGEAYPKTVICSHFIQIVIKIIAVWGDMAVYYVIQVAPGKEKETERYIEERVSQECYSSCFHPMRHVRKKFHGVWKDRHERLLPGYVFIKSENAKELYLDLKRIPMMTKLLGWEREFITALTEQEAEWLEKIVSAGENGKINGEVALSTIEVDENDQVRILSGPLKNMTGMVKRINVHKRIAEVEVEFMGRKIVLYLGIEMVGKKK